MEGKDFFKLGIILAFILAVLAAFYGWAANIVQLLTGFDAMSTGEAIARAVGIFAAPIGIVMGYM